MTGNNSELKKLQALSFALVEATLYLDGHPHDKRALRYYNDMLAAYNEALAAYERMHGPVTLSSQEITDGDMWQWVNHPWPWQNEMN